MAPFQAGNTPQLDIFIRGLKSHPLEASTETLVSLLKRRQISGSRPCAIAAVHILRQVVAKAPYRDVDGLIAKIQQTGQRLVHAQPHELAVGNIVRRVLGLIREEMQEDRTEFGGDSVSDLQTLCPEKEKETKEHVVGLPVLSRAPTLGGWSHQSAPFSIMNLLSPDQGSGAGSPMGRSGTSTPMLHGQNLSINNLKSEVLDGIDEITDELEQVDDQIAGYADIQIHPTDYILVHELDSTTERFLLRASRERRFTVFIAQGKSTTSKAGDATPSLFQKKLNSAGVKTINISNTGLAAYMTKVDKVILSVRGVTADGGAVAESGATAIAQAARAFGKPVVVLMGMYKLSPESTPDPRSLVEWGEPESFVNFSKGNMVNTVEVEVPLTEFVAPGLVDTYISNIGVHTQDHLPSLIVDHYNEQDSDFVLTIPA
ncbi:hypothetical protein MKZ38_008564 [Zalerion maritima]|uniref:Translation initiation factor eIF2B subunit beta n=1 Tax=Zalerion maritima TaxID=339359 RepID=A0AAD5RVA6_9PEZI|nr:hypothetical protein MKZ38_008564 [Zalerion maritima]